MQAPPAEHSSSVMLEASVSDDTSSWRRTTSELHYHMQSIRETKHSCSWHSDMVIRVQQQLWTIFSMSEGGTQKLFVWKVVLTCLASTCDTCMHREKDHKCVNMRNEV